LKRFVWDFVWGVAVCGELWSWRRDGGLRTLLGTLAAGVGYLALIALGGRFFEGRLVEE
jgi:hypothetical protein